MHLAPIDLTGCHCPEAGSDRHPCIFKTLKLLQSNAAAPKGDNLRCKTQMQSKAEPIILQQYPKDTQTHQSS